VQRLSSVICHLSSVIRHPSFDIRHLVFSRCGHGCGLFACIRSCILAGLGLLKRAREVEANKMLAQGIRQLGKAMMVTS